MSDWEIVDNNKPSQPSVPQSDWEIMAPNPENRSLRVQPWEGLATAAWKAPFRIGEDVGHAVMGGLQALPGYYESAKTEIPGVFDALRHHPGHAAMQGLAGAFELANSLSQAPLNIAQYGANRLNLLPHWVPEAIGKITPKDTTEAINQLFGAPQYPGEALVRGIPRNALNIYGAGKLAAMLNPLNLSAKNIAKDIINTGEANKNLYGNLYNNLWKEAEQKGFGDALYNVDIDMRTLKKFSPAKSIKGVVDFDSNPTLQNAHAAKSDLLRIKRDLDKLPTLRSAERQQLKAVNDAIESIKNNMFRDASGELDNNMLNKYDALQQGYAKEVIPYKNTNINKFKRNELSANELVNALSKGEFAAKRGKYHPAMGARKIFGDHPYLTGIGLGGLGALGARSAIDYMRPEANEQ